MKNRVRGRTRKPITDQAVSISISLPGWMLDAADNRARLVYRLTTRSGYVQELVRRDTAQAIAAATNNGNG